MDKYNVIAELNNEAFEETVVSTYKSTKTKSAAYQSEAELEKCFIDLLKEQGYEYLPIHTENDLISNLRKQLEELNKYKFSDDEWHQIFDNYIANPLYKNDIGKKTSIIQEEGRINLKKDDGLTKNITLIDKDNIHNNKLQVINQYINNDGEYKNRYDVTILVNGFPLVHIELKRRGVDIKEAFNQIERYQRESFGASEALFEYVQIFVISNGTFTKYYSNSTRWNHIEESKRSEKKTKTSNSFEFTSYWATAEKNEIITDLVDFTQTFFAKHTILNILTKYCVFTVDKMLMVMRPYQIAATERILNKIEISNNYKKYGSIEGGGYIWHTTGSGKTLTSFKTAQLASKLTYIDKVIFVVDRKDLDYQTMKEYDKFQKDAANSNKSTTVLKRQLENVDEHGNYKDYKIIITTIQKLSIFIKKNKGHEVFNKHVVIIFDECHRSQFGEMHKDIIKNFKKYYIFGFTGTPIFEINATVHKDTNLLTTEQTFGKKLHSYTIVNAICDENVLPFKVDYIKTMDIDPDIDDEEVYDINREKVFMDHERIKLVTEYILSHFNQKTYRFEKSYSFNKVMNISDITKSKTEIKENKSKVSLSGFNSVFAVSSIEMAKLYYEEFKKQMDENPSKKLNLALIYSYGANEEEADGILDDENPEDTSSLDLSSREFLDKAIDDYNKMFSTNFSTSSDNFQNYYKDVSMRVKNKEIDLLIVVNMFLTGFDATTLNTLWVDKNLKMHGLIQAFSRTNRILNSIKKCGNIVCFRNLEKRTNAAISLFGDENASGIILIKGFNDYYYGFTDDKGKVIEGYKDMIDSLISKYPLGTYISEQKKLKDFCSLYGAILRMKNLLLSFDEFTGKEILSELEYQDYSSMYLDARDRIIKYAKDTTDINNDIVFEVEFLKQVDINIDYILMLVEKYHDTHCEDKELLIQITKALGSSPNLRSKKALIETFIQNINDVSDVLIEWNTYIAEQKEKELMDIIKTENLNEELTRKFISDSLSNGFIKTIGTDLESILPPTSLFDGGSHEEKKQRVIDKLNDFFDKFYGLN